MFNVLNSLEINDNHCRTFHTVLVSHLKDIIKIKV